MLLLVLTAKLGDPNIAKEVGIAQMLGAHAVVMITTGTVIDMARQFAQQACDQLAYRCT